MEKQPNTISEKSAYKDGIVFTIQNLHKHAKLLRNTEFGDNLTEHLANLVHRRHELYEQAEQAIGVDQQYSELLDKPKQAYYTIITDYQKEKEIFRKTPLCALLYGLREQWVVKEFEPVKLRVFHLSILASKFIKPRVKFEQFSQDFIRARFLQTRAEYTKSVQHLLQLSKLPNQFKSNYIKITQAHFEQIQQDVHENIAILADNFGLFTDRNAVNLELHFSQCYMQGNDIALFKALYNHLYEFFCSMHDNDMFLQQYQGQIIKIAACQKLCDLQESLFDRSGVDVLSIESINEDIVGQSLLISENSQLGQAKDHYGVRALIDDQLIACH